MIKILEPTPDQIAGLDKQLENVAFEEYTGVSIKRAKEICIENNLDFNDEFWIPFENYIADIILRSSPCQSHR